jgi:hypothetical protein
MLKLIIGIYGGVMLGIIVMCLCQIAGEASRREEANEEADENANP